MGKTAGASGTKTSSTPAAVVLAGAIGCFAAGYGAHSLGSATKTIHKAVQTKLPTAIKNLLPTFTTASPKNTALAPAIHEAKPAESLPSVQATMVAKNTEVKVTKSEQPLRQPNKSLDHSGDEEGRADANETKLATTPAQGPPEAEVAFASGKLAACPGLEAAKSGTKPKTNAARSQSETE